MILAIKTADATAHLWLYPASEVSTAKAEISWESGRALADELLARLTSFIQDQAGGWPAITGIIIFSGPGSFTSLRIGHSIANALAASLGVPVTGAGADNWVETATAALKTAATGQLALPYYGAEANITPSKT